MWTGHSLRQAQGGLCPLPLTLLLAYDLVTCNWTSLPQSGITVILMRFHFDERKSERLRANPKRRIGFEEAQELFAHPYYLDQRSDWPEQYRAIGWVGDILYSLIFEMREDEQGEYYHLVTLWKATKEERQLYEEHS